MQEGPRAARVAALSASVLIVVGIVAWRPDQRRRRAHPSRTAHDAQGVGRASDIFARRHSMAFTWAAAEGDDPGTEQVGHVREDHRVFRVRRVTTSHPGGIGIRHGLPTAGTSRSCTARRVAAFTSRRRWVAQNSRVSDLPIISRDRLVA